MGPGGGGRGEPRFESPGTGGAAAPAGAPVRVRALVQARAVVRVRARAVVLSLLLVALLVPGLSIPVPGLSTRAAWAASDVVLGDTAFTQAVVDAVNAARSIAGEAAVARSAALDQAAQAHAEYLVANASRWGAGFDAHREDRALPGFYGETSADRVQRAGYPHTKVMEAVLRLETFAADDSPYSAGAVVSSWVDPPLHRRAVIERSVLEVGFGYASDGFHHAYVLEAGQDFFAPQKPSGLQPYPADGQQGVPVGWEINENPAPFPGLSGEIGYPITVFPVHGGSGFIGAQLSLTRVGDDGVVPVAQSPAPRNYAFATAEPLLPGTEYHAALFYTMRNEYDGTVTSGALVWEFTTAGAPPPTTTTTLPPTTTTTTTAPPTTTTTAPPSSTTTIPSPTFVDVPATHPYRAAIEAVAAAGVVQGSLDVQGRRIFRPDQPVVRQQFAKMIIEALSLPVSEADVCPFEDVGRSGPAELYPDNYVAVAAARGITRGTSVSPPRFSPWRPISRAQVITMIVRAARTERPSGLRPPPADFVGQVPSTDPTHGDNIRWAESNGLLRGITLPGWDVWHEAGRGEVAQMLWNLMRLSEG